MPDDYAQIFLFVSLLLLVSMNPSFVVTLSILPSTHPWRRLTVRAENTKTDILCQLSPLDILLASIPT
jgi:hypothetical protein